MPPLRKARRIHTVKRYSRSIPVDRVQMGTMKVVPGVYQYTAVDDCSRFRVLGGYTRAAGANTLDFPARVVEEMPFPIQRIQSDRGGELFHAKVQSWLNDNMIMFRRISPRSPHFDGKVECSQMTDLQEFWARQKPPAPEIRQRIEEWQFDYNRRRPHGLLGGKRPVDRLGELSSVTALNEDVAIAYDPVNERYRHRDYKAERTLAVFWQLRQNAERAAGADAADCAVARGNKNSIKPSQKNFRSK